MLATIRTKKEKVIKMSENPVNSASWRARYIKRGGNEKGLRELFLMYERSFNVLEVLGVKWSD